MVKRALRFAVFIAVAFLIALPVFGETLGETKNRVYDYAGLFSESDVSRLEERIADFREKTGMDYVVLTSVDAVYSSNDAAAEKNGMAFADDFYIDNGFGESGLIFFIDMSNRMPIITTGGAMINYINDSRLESLLDDSWEYLYDGKYADSAYSMIGSVENFIDDGILEGQYLYDAETGERLSSPYRALTFGEVSAAFGVAVATGLLIYVVTAARYKLKGKSFSYSARNTASARVISSKDDYIRTSVIRRQKPKSPPPSSRGSGGGLGSSVHRSSGGGMRGGGGGRRF